MKYWPLWILLKWDKYLVKFSLSATIVKPAVCCRSSCDLVTRLPVARKFSSFFPILTYESTNFFRYTGLRIAL